MKTLQEMNKRERESYKAGVEICKEFMTQLNIMGYESFVIQGFIRQLKSSHRTLQQNFGRLISTVIIEMSKDKKNNRFDLRNEAFVTLCSKMEKTVMDSYLPFI